MRNSIILLLIFLFSCSKVNSDQTYIAQLEIQPTIEYVAPNPPAKPDQPKNILALKVRESNKEEYHLGLDEISGFVFEEGNRYKLKVQITILASPPLDGNDKTYKLLEVISKQQATINNIMKRTSILCEEDSKENY
ncbi:DUF4377 domain-containing protein [Sphingobacterium thalpophilum]|uniref:DUF4377 domain-containing protein n=1 Tax=Sphingobacterium thalpophilum TaxID=259 RepID=UPI0031CF758D